LATPDQVENLRKSLGLDQPILIQYFRFLSSLLHGNLGTSLYTGRSVDQIILEQLPATAQLALTALTISIMLGLLLGVIAGWKKHTFFGIAAANLANLATALPVAFTGILAILALNTLVNQFPGMTGAFPFSNLLLPSGVLGFASGGAIARVVESGLRDNINAPFLLAARARGLSRGLRLLWHALKPALPAVVSLSALEAAFLFSGTVVTEMVFSRPGIGRLLVASILQGDFPVAQGIVVLAAVLYTASHSFADILALILDPRLRREK
jgi:peptide/nickel transport system permease protein